MKRVCPSCKKSDQVGDPHPSDGSYYCSRCETGFGGTRPRNWTPRYIDRNYVATQMNLAVEIIHSPHRVHLCLQRIHEHLGIEHELLPLRDLQARRKDWAATGMFIAIGSMALTLFAVTLMTASALEVPPPRFLIGGFLGVALLSAVLAVIARPR